MSHQKNKNSVTSKLWEEKKITCMKARKEMERHVGPGGGVERCCVRLDTCEGL